MKMKTSREEAKESAYRLGLIMETNGDEHRMATSGLIGEAIQLKKIFSSIVQNSSQDVFRNWNLDLSSS